MRISVITPFYKKSLMLLTLIVMSLALARITEGFFACVLTLYGGIMALSKKPDRAICIYLLMPLMIIVSSVILPKSSVLYPIAFRFGTFFIAISLCIASSRRRGRNRLPFGGIIPFLIAAIISSAGGWLPMVSYLKLVNYFVFMLGIWYGTQNLQNDPEKIFTIRSMLFAMIVFFIVGSYLVMPFPAIANANMLRQIIAANGIESASSALQAAIQNNSLVLFCGITNHSQALAPIAALSFAWLVCDMLFIERRFLLGHSALIALSIPLLYMTRSRVALTTFVSSIIIISLYSVRKVSVPCSIKTRLRTVLYLFVALFIVGAGVAESKNKTFTRWIRKTQDIDGDTRELGDAVTASRQGLMEYSLYEYRRNPMFGSGFQVAEMNRDMVKDSVFVFSAPIEKGVLPVMVLGETGIVGLTLFIVFLISFYVSAISRRLYITVTLFSLLLVTNMGEASFFSPGGVGSMLWILTVVGGFMIDTQLLYANQIRRLTNFGIEVI